MLKKAFTLLRDTFTEWGEDRVSILAAGLAYYTTFSIAPLLILIIGLVGLVANRQEVQVQILARIETTLGQDATLLVSELIENAIKPKESIMATIIGAGVLFLGALGIFHNLQIALDQIWNVRKVKKKGVVKRFVRDRLFSFGMLLLIVGFLLLVSLVLNTALSFVDIYLLALLPELGVFVWLLSILSSFTIKTLLFMLIYKYLPHAEIQWKDVWFGAVVTAFLSTIGRTLLGFYLSNSSISSTYGAAGTFLLILVWVYYSSQIILFGAEFTQVFAKHYGSHIVPDALLDTETESLHMKITK